MVNKDDTQKSLNNSTEDKNLKLITNYLKNITIKFRSDVDGILIFYKIIAIISFITPNILSYLGIISPSQQLDNMLTILAILGVILLTVNLINIFWKLPKYLMSESSLVCLQLFNVGDRFWKYCNKNWLIGFITSFLRLPTFIFATILYHTVLLMEKVKNIPAMIKSIPSKIKSLVTKTKL